MEEKIREFVNSIFATVSGGTQLVTLKSNMTRRLTDRYYKYIDDGKTPSEAYGMISSSTQEILDAIDGFLHSSKSSGPSGSGHAPYSRGAASRSTSSSRPASAAKAPKAPPAQNAASKSSKSGSGMAALGIIITSGALLLVVVFGLFIVRNLNLYNNLNEFITENSSYSEAYPSDPAQQWDQAQYDDFDFHEDGIYRISHSELKSLDKLNLSWESGSVTIATHGGDDIILQETSESGVTARSALRYSVGPSSLTISDKAEDAYYGAQKKDLTILLPSSLISSPAEMHMSLGSTDLKASGMTFGQTGISASSGTIELDDIICAGTFSMRTGSADAFVSGQLADFDFFSQSGDLNFTSKDSLGVVSASSVSGNISVSGSVHRAELDTRSGSIRVKTGICPYKLDVTSISGDTELVLPERSDFTLDFKTATGKLDSRLSLVDARGQLVYGDGIASFTVETDSGDLRIEKNSDLSL